MGLEWSLFGFTLVGTVLRSALGAWEGIRFSDESFDWKRAGLTLVEGAVLGLVLSFTSLTGVGAGLAGYLGVDAFKKLGIEYKR